jgi:23S rRNA pseudouridine2605 synthase
MELPSTGGIPRTYRARTFGDISQDQLEELIEGIDDRRHALWPIDANMERRTGRNQWIELTLTEGKNREVRRVLEHLGLKVSRLLRTKYGPFELLDLPRGAAVEIRQVDVERFRKTLKGDVAQEGPRPSQEHAGCASSVRSGDEDRRRRLARAQACRALRARPPAPPPTALARRCSLCWSAGSALSRA